MPTAAVAAPPVARSRFDWAELNPLADLRVRYGIKVGLAAVLALFLAQVLRLEHPNWSVLAVLVLTNAHYVGAIATKALMRSIGTIAGAFIGIWVVGDYANTPLVFILVVFLVVTIAAYKFGQLASAASPYAYYLMGLSLVSVATYAISDPADVWRIALYRTLETLVGVASATLVYSILWPRYAREEFVTLAGETVKTVRALLNEEAHAYIGEAVDPGRVLDLRDVFSRQIIGLRALLITGGRGSIYFRARLGNYQRFVVAMTHLFQALLALQRRRAEEGELLSRIQPELDRFTAALDADLAILGDIASPRRGLPPAELNAAFAALESRVKELREQGLFLRSSVPADEAFFGHYAALRLIRDELNMVQEVVGELPRLHLPFPHPNKRHSVLPAIDRFWAQESLKAGLATCLAFLLLKWVHPPGAASIPLGAWIFSTFGRMSIGTGGSGDVRTFQRMSMTILIGLPVVALLWLAMPLLSNYWAMNALLFVLCYVFGFITVRTPGFSFFMQIMVLGINTLVALNPQVPVTFGLLRDSFLGLAIGLVIGGTVSRVIWPVLPQGLFRRNLIQYFENLRTLLGDSEDHEFILTGAVHLPFEALQSTQGMVLPRCHASERHDLANFIRMIHPLGMEITTLRARSALPIPSAAQSLLQGPMAALESTLDEFLAKFALCFRNYGATIDFPDLRAELDAVDAVIAKVRDERIVAADDIDSVSHMLELVDRYHSIAERLLSSREQLSKLSLHRYLRDIAL